MRKKSKFSKLRKPAKDNGWWYHNVQKESHSLIKKKKEDKKANPKLCILCNKAWHYVGNSYKYLNNFPKLGTHNLICPNCKNDSLIEAYSYNDS